jgi:signal transduction histidine kinase
LTSLLERARRIDLQLVDYLAALLIACDLILEAALEHGIPHRASTALLAIPLCTMVALRRRFPAAAVNGCSVTALFQEPFHGQLFMLNSSVVLFPFALCAYGVGAWLPMRRSLVAVASAALLLATDQVIQTEVTERSSTGGLGAGIALSLILFAVPWLVGRFIAERQRRAEAFAALAAQTEAEQVQRERAAIEQERVLIGRELQDIIAHSVTVMVIQAAGARRLLRTEPDRATESILTVERTGRETLAEMRRLLGLLRQDDDPRALAPQPGLGRLNELIGSIERMGVICKLQTKGEPTELTPGIDLVGYRVVEAGLIEAAEARCTAATATITYGPAWLALEVRGDRQAPASAPELAAVRERVALYGGRMTIDPHGPFTLSCQLPLEAAVAA